MNIKSFKFAVYVVKNRSIIPKRYKLKLKYNNINFVNLILFMKFC